MNKLLTRAAAAMALCAIGPFAQASTVLQQTGFANAGDWVTVATTGGPHAGTFYVGEFTGTVDGKSFTSYCIDLAQYFSFNTPYTNYVATDALTVLGAKKTTQLGELLTAAGGFALGTPSRSAALQGGIWEILYETSGSLALGGGSFTIRPGSVLAADLTAVDGWLAHLSDYGTTAFSAYLSPTQQDFITASHDVPLGPLDTGRVPEPSSLALALLGLAGAGSLKRRARR